MDGGDDVDDVDDTVFIRSEMDDLLTRGVTKWMTISLMVEIVYVSLSSCRYINDT